MERHPHTATVAPSGINRAASAAVTIRGVIPNLLFSPFWVRVVEYG